jgi:hypothetical protein
MTEHNRRPTDDETRATAVCIYVDEGSIEIDHNAQISRVSRGAYVQAWVWVPDDYVNEHATLGCHSDK